MPTYVMLSNWTDQGIRDVKNSVERYEAGHAMMARFGVTIKDILWTIGPYDAVLIVEAPDDATFSRLALAVGSQGNIRTISMRAYTKDEMKEILGRLP